MKYLTIFALCFIARCGFASLVPMEGFPTELSHQILAEKMLVDGRESHVYTIRSTRDLASTVTLLKEWLFQSKVRPQVTHREGRIYISQRRSGWWITAQVDELTTGTQVGGLLIFWRDQGSSLEERSFAQSALSSLSALQQGRVVKQVQSVDTNRSTLTLTISSKLSLNTLYAAFERDFRRMELTTANFSPLASASATSGHIAQVWTGANTQISITLFEHRGDSVAVLHWLGFNSKANAGL
jgi:hypothetical protein